MRLPSKNMCSVRVRPMPSAPNLIAVLTCSGVSELVRVDVTDAGTFRDRDDVAVNGSPIEGLSVVAFNESP